MTSSPSSSSSEDESDASAEQHKTTLLAKPVFVAKTDRVHLQEELNLQTEEELKQLRQLEEEQQRREENTRALVREQLAQEKEQAEQIRLGLERGTKSTVEVPTALGEFEMPSDDIPEERTQAEFEAWKLRELARLKRDWLRAHAEDLKKAEKDCRRRLTDAEKAAENEQLRLERLEQSGVRKGKMQFMQKYYHKGAFFQNIVETGTEEAFKKDFNEAIGVEKVDITLLPKCMQVRRGDFGKRSRSKYTHLKDQDTSDRSAGWNK